MAFPVARSDGGDTDAVMTSLAAVQEAILQLRPEEQARLRDWLGSNAINPEEDSPELELALLQAVRGPHSILNKADLEALAERALRERRVNQHG